jgi:hypothetical protein
MADASYRTKNQHLRRTNSPVEDSKKQLSRYFAQIDSLDAF